MIPTCRYYQELVYQLKMEDYNLHRHSGLLKILIWGTTERKDHPTGSRSSEMSIILNNSFGRLLTREMLEKMYH